MSSGIGFLALVPSSGRADSWRRPRRDRCGSRRTSAAPRRPRRSACRPLSELRSRGRRGRRGAGVWSAASRRGRRCRCRGRIRRAAARTASAGECPPRARPERMPGTPAPRHTLTPSLRTTGREQSPPLATTTAREPCRPRTAALGPWQAAQASPKGAVLTKACAAADCESWQPRQAAAVGCCGVYQSRGVWVGSRPAGRFSRTCCVPSTWHVSAVAAVAREATR